VSCKDFSARGMTGSQRALIASWYKKKWLGHLNIKASREEWGWVFAEQKLCTAKKVMGARNEFVEGNLCFAAAPSSLVPLVDGALCQV
jgi:hypothetical protein